MDTLLDYEPPFPQPKELLAKRREQFLLFRRVMRLLLGCLLVVTIALVIYIFTYNESAVKWLVLPIPIHFALVTLGM